MRTGVESTAALIIGALLVWHKVDWQWAVITLALGFAIMPYYPRRP